MEGPFRDLLSACRAAQRGCHSAEFYNCRLTSCGSQSTQQNLPSDWFETVEPNGRTGEPPLYGSPPHKRISRIHSVRPVCDSSHTVPYSSLLFDHTVPFIQCHPYSSDHTIPSSSIPFHTVPLLLFQAYDSNHTIPTTQPHTVPIQFFNYPAAPQT